MKSLVLLSLILFSSCSSRNATGPKSNGHADDALLATNWFQTAGETKALYLQGYALAKIRFDEANKKSSQKPKAVVVDIDETILDNSPYQAKLIKEKALYPMYWKEWIDSEAAAALPGAVDFLNYVTSKKAKVFYISNRKEHERKSTFNNLKKLGFPVSDENELLLRPVESEKGKRRSLVAKTHDIVLLVGDNLNDFDSVFEGKSPSERGEIVGALKHEIGKKFIILPNPLYGDWEGSLYHYNFRADENEKHRIRKESLRSF